MKQFCSDLSRIVLLTKQLLIVKADVNEVLSTHQGHVGEVVAPVVEQVPGGAHQLTLTAHLDVNVTSTRLTSVHWNKQ